MAPPKKVGMLTAGGLAPCLSSAVAALIEEYTRVSPETEIICYLNGYRGVLLGESLRVTPEIRKQAYKLHRLGGSPIGNSRVKLTNIKDCVKRGLIKEGEDPQRVAAEQLIKDEIDVLHTIGGDDTNLAAASLAEFIDTNFVNQKKVTVVGLPKTIDNDVIPVSQTLGAETAAQQGAIFFTNVVSEHSASPRMLIIHEIMGRHCGWLAARTAHKYIEMEKPTLHELEDKGALGVHAVFIPEMYIDLEEEGKRLKGVMDKLGCVNIFLSEGAGIDTIVGQMEADGQEVERDPFGHVKIDKISPGQWFADRLKKLLKAEKVLVQKSGYFCRAAAAGDFDRDLIERCAKFAVNECALKGQAGLVAQDEAKNDEISAIDFKRIAGGKHFDTDVEWFGKVLESIGQKKVGPDAPEKPASTEATSPPSDLTNASSPRLSRQISKMSAIQQTTVSVTTALQMSQAPEAPAVDDLLKGRDADEASALRDITTSIMSACKNISGHCQRAGLEAGELESSAQLSALNKLAHNVMMESLASSQAIAAVMSHESKDPIVTAPKCSYVCVMDPLDGFSNIRANVSVGSIFAVHKRSSDGELKENDTKDFLQKGSSIVMSGYCMYGPATVIMVTFGHGVHGFTYDQTEGKFKQTHNNVKIPSTGAYYSVNEGYADEWLAPTIKFVESCRKSKKTLRYIGSMVADIHRTLLYGGIFMYPADKSRSKGKLRLVYESNPIAFLIEQAGGSASDGSRRLLDVEPTNVHEQTPVAIGSSDLVSELERCFKKSE